MRQQKDVCYSAEPCPKRTLDLYLPDGECRGALLFFHGGGMVSGFKTELWREGVYLAEHGYAFLSADYRLYPEAVYPQFICDAAEAVAWAKKNLPALCGCERLCVGGSSAGAYLSMMLCFDERYLAAVGCSNRDIAGYLHDAGQPTAHFTVLQVSGEDPRRVIVDERAPLYYVGQAAEYPPMRFWVSDDDMPGRYEQTLLLRRTLESFGHQNHDLQLFHGAHTAYYQDIDGKGIPKTAYLMEEFLREHLK